MHMTRQEWKKDSVMDQLSWKKQAKYGDITSKKKKKKIPFTQLKMYWKNFCISHAYANKKEKGKNKLNLHLNFLRI